MRPNSIFTVCSVLLAAAVSANAQEKSELPLWEIGAFGLGVSQQAYPGSDQQVQRALAFPYLIYRGQFLRSDGNNVGLRALNTDNFELDIGLAGSFGSGSKEIKARAGMPKLGTLVEFGPRAKWKLSESPGQGRWSVELPVRGVFDISDSAAFRGIAAEPRLVFANRLSSGWNYSVSASALLGSQKLTDTYYGVSALQATAGRPQYTAKSGLIATRLGLAASKQLSNDWRFFTFARLDSVSGAANDSSPLVRKTNGFSVGAGVSYTWLRSAEKAMP